MQKWTCFVTEEMGIACTSKWPAYLTTSIVKNLVHRVLALSWQNLFHLPNILSGIAKSYESLMVYVNDWN